MNERPSSFKEILLNWVDNKFGRKALNGLMFITFLVSIALLGTQYFKTYKADSTQKSIETINKILALRGGMTHELSSYNKDVKNLYGKIHVENMPISTESCIVNLVTKYDGYYEVNDDKQIRIEGQLTQIFNLGHIARVLYDKEKNVFYEGLRNYQMKYGALDTEIEYSVILLEADEKSSKNRYGFSYTDEGWYFKGEEKSKFKEVRHRLNMPKISLYINNDERDIFMERLASLINDCRNDSLFSTNTKIMSWQERGKVQ